MPGVGGPGDPGPGDGRVEGAFEGPADVVGRLVAWCRQGPPRAEVTGVEVAAEAPTGDGGFLVR